MARNRNIANTYYGIKMKERCAQSIEMIFFGGRVDFRKSGCAEKKYRVVTKLLRSNTSWQVVIYPPNP